MSAREFGTDAAKARVKNIIVEVESLTSAELLVAVRESSGHYRHADYLFGVGLAYAGLLVFIFHPRPIRSDLFPLEFLGLFLLGVIASSLSPGLRRLLTSGKLMKENVERAARACSVDLGLANTRRRTGVLVYYSAAERSASVVLDAGIDAALLAAPWQALQDEFDGAARAADLDAFCAALAKLGPLLGEHYPRAHDDENELSDELDAA